MNREDERHRLKFLLTSMLLSRLDNENDYCLSRVPQLQKKIIRRS